MGLGLTDNPKGFYADLDTNTDLGIKYDNQTKPNKPNRQTDKSHYPENNSIDKRQKDRH